jgi:hypothetical protein
MSNAVTTQILVDGPRNMVVKVTGILDTSDLSSTAVVDPTTGDFPCSKLSIEKITYAIEDALAVNIYWDATTPVLIETLTGRSKTGGWHFGGLVNNGGSGRTGKINISTQGWASGDVLSFSLIFECTKSDK